MRQLTSFDAQALAPLDDGRNHAHASAPAICDPTTAPRGKVTIAAVRELVASRLHMLPPPRWRLAEVPLGLDYPYWADAAEFDLDFHIRELALPEPGDRQMLAEHVARIVSRPLDRSRPLWAPYLIHGLDGGRVAMLTRLHRAAVDGASVAELLGILLGNGPGPAPGRPVPAVPGGKEMPSQLGMLARGLRGVPRPAAQAQQAQAHRPGALPTRGAAAVIEVIRHLARRLAYQTRARPRKGARRV